MKQFRSVFIIAAVLLSVSLFSMTAIAHSPDSSSSGGMGMMSGNGSNVSAMHEMMDMMGSMSDEEQAEMAEACLEMMREVTADDMAPGDGDSGDMMR